MPSVHQFVPTAPKKKNKPSAQNFVWKKRGNFVPKIHDFDPSKSGINKAEFELSDQSCILDFFEAFVTPSLLGKVAFETNRYCQQFDNVTPGSRLPHNHLPPNVDIPMVHLRRSIGLAGTSTGNLATSIRQIYNQEVVLRELLQSITMAGVDVTFKTVPKNLTDLRKGCLLTFHIVFRNVSFPMVYASTTRMTQSTYESFLRIVQEIVPLNYNRLTIITDYERGLMNAIRIIFPYTKLQGCWFHYCQSVIWYCKRSMHSLFDLFQTTVEAASVLRMVLALSHLPAETQINCRFTMFDGFQIIVEYVNGQQSVTRERLVCIAFFKRQQIGG
ncbi:hypothetical protein ACI65C_006520 [Semiaphis heraclei]